MKGRSFLCVYVLLLTVACSGVALTLTPPAGSEHRQVLTSTPVPTHLPSPTLLVSTSTPVPTPLSSPTTLVSTSTPALTPQPMPVGKPDIMVDCAAPLTDGPIPYGTNGWWTDQDADLWRARYAELGPRVVRLPLVHQFLEPANDDDDPAHIRWEGFAFDQSIPWEGRTVTYHHWFEALHDTGAEVMVSVLYLAGWLSRNGDNGLYSTYPPRSLEEYGEFVRATLVYLIEQIGYPPERIILEPVNEPDLRCGQDLAVPCFWSNWTMSDLVGVVSTACQVADEVDSRIRVVGLAECCGTDLVRAFLEEYGGKDCLDGLTYHRYVHTWDFNDGLARGRVLQGYGLPVYINEYGHTRYWSNGREGALWHSLVLSQLWAEGIAPVQFMMSEFAEIAPGYNELGLFEDWTEGWERKPAYWVYASFFRHLGEAVPVAVKEPGGNMTVVAGRRGAGDAATVVVWVTNGGEPRPDTRFRLNSGPAGPLTVAVYDNLAGLAPVDVLTLDEGESVFALDIPPFSSHCLVIRGRV